MNGLTKAKINFKEGIIELVGSEAFVTKQLELLQVQIKNMGKEDNKVDISGASMASSQTQDASKASVAGPK